MLLQLKYLIVRLFLKYETSIQCFRDLFLFQWQKTLKGTLLFKEIQKEISQFSKGVDFYFQ